MKQTKNYLSIAALVAVGALTIACTDLKNEISGQDGNDGVVTLTVPLSLDDTPGTRALDAAGHKTFAQNDQIAVFYKDADGNTQKAVSKGLNESDISTDGKKATFHLVTKSPKTDGPVRLIYPAAMAKVIISAVSEIDDGNTIDYAALNAQDGTLASLAAELDLCTYDGIYSDLDVSDSDKLPKLTNRLAILACTLLDDFNEINSSLVEMTISTGTDTYVVSRTAAPGPIYVAIRPIVSANIEVTATNAIHSYTKSLTGKTYAAGNGYPVTWRMTKVQ